MFRVKYSKACLKYPTVGIENLRTESRPLRDEFATSRKGASAFSDQDQFFRLEKIIYGEMEESRGGVIVYGSQILDAAQRIEVRKRLTPGPASSQEKEEDELEKDEDEEDEDEDENELKEVEDEDEDEDEAVGAVEQAEAEHQREGAEVLPQKTSSSKKRTGQREVEEPPSKKRKVEDK